MTSYDGAAITCAGVLLGQPVTSGSLPHATGAAKVFHWAEKLPSAIGRMQLSMEAVGLALPLDPPSHTPIKLTLDPDPASTHGAGHFTGTSSIAGAFTRSQRASRFSPARTRGTAAAA